MFIENYEFQKPNFGVTLARENSNDSCLQYSQFNYGVVSIVNNYYFFSLITPILLTDSNPPICIALQTPIAYCYFVVFSKY